MRIDFTQTKWYTLILMLLMILMRFKVINVVLNYVTLSRGFILSCKRKRFKKVFIIHNTDYLKCAFEFTLKVRNIIQNRKKYKRKRNGFFIDISYHLINFYLLLSTIWYESYNVKSRINLSYFLRIDSSLEWNIGSP